MELPPAQRKTALLLHVTSSVGWLGVTAGNLVLAVAAFDRPVLYQALALLGDYVVLPLSLLSSATGVLVSVGTRWGLVKHRWVLVKLVSTAAAVVATVFALRSGLHAAAAGESGAGTQVLVACCVSLVIYVANTALSVFKPRGRTRWG